MLPTKLWKISDGVAMAQALTKITPELFGNHG
jgi:hypothetical protein